MCVLLHLVCVVKILILLALSSIYYRTLLPKCAIALLNLLLLIETLCHLANFSPFLLPISFWQATSSLLL